MFEWIDRLLHPESYTKYDLWVEDMRFRQKVMERKAEYLRKRLEDLREMVEEHSNAFSGKDGGSS